MGSLTILFHILAAVLFLGPVTVAVSTFQVQALKAYEGSQDARGAAKMLYRITSTYSMLSLLVPLSGFAVMMVTGEFWSQGRFHASILLSLIGWALLLFVIAPKQKAMMGALGLLEEDENDNDYQISDWGKAKAQLSMFGGIFALLWVVTAVLMMLPRFGVVF